MPNSNQERWTLIVVFDTIKVQKDRDAFVETDFSSAFIRYLQRRWSTDTDGLKELATWTAIRVAVQVDLLDYLTDVMEWLIMNTIPKSMTLRRNEEL